MDWLWYVVLLVMQITGLVMNILGLPGLWVMVLSTGAYAWLTYDRDYVHWYDLVILLVLAIAAEIVEFVAGSAGAKKAGGSALGQVGAIIGGIAGAILGSIFIPIPVVGTIVGACAGSFAGSMGIEWYRRGDVDHSVRVGWGAAKGRFWGILAKTGFGIAILLLTIIMAIPLGGTTPPTISPSPVLTTAPAATTVPVEPATQP